MGAAEQAAAAQPRQTRIGAGGRGGGGAIASRAGVDRRRRARARRRSRVGHTATFGIHVRLAERRSAHVAVLGQPHIFASTGADVVVAVAIARTGTADSRAVEGMGEGRRWGAGGRATAPAHRGSHGISAISSWGCRKPETFRRCRAWSAQSLTVQRA